MKLEAKQKAAWSRLFEAAIAFKKQACWSWMSNADYFAVTDPESGVRGYCIPMGNGGIEFGLNVYWGPEGLDFLQDIMEGTAGLIEDEVEMHHRAKLLSVTFEDREELQKPDLELIKALGFRFRGSRQWPLFRSYEPGYEQWFLHEGQVRFLAIALEQAVLVGDRFRENPNMYQEHGEHEESQDAGPKRLHRVPAAEADEVVWKDEWLPWQEERREEPLYRYPNEFLLTQLKKSLKISNEVWESDYQYAPITIGERNVRGIFPRLCLWVNQQSGMIMGLKLIDHSDCREEFVDQWMELLQQTNCIPMRVEVGSSKAYRALKHTAGVLGVQLELNPALEELGQAMETIVRSF